MNHYIIQHYCAEKPLSNLHHKYRLSTAKVNHLSFEIEVSVWLSVSISENPAYYSDASTGDPETASPTAKCTLHICLHLSVLLTTARLRFSASPFYSASATNAILTVTQIHRTYVIHHWTQNNPSFVSTSHLFRYFFHNSPHPFSYLTRFIYF